jgi:hypothetical protein
MTTLTYGSTIVKGNLIGFTAGSSEIELDFGNGFKILLSLTGEYDPAKFDKIRQTMNMIGLKGMRNSTIDFNNGIVNIVEGPVQKVVPKSTIKSSFIS